MNHYSCYISDSLWNLLKVNIPMCHSFQAGVTHNQLLQLNLRLKRNETNTHSRIKLKTKLMYVLFFMPNPTESLQSP